MGTDIHMVAQVRRNNEWETIKTKNKWFGQWKDEPEFVSRISINRNYDLFAILANVRNGRGFAGVVTGAGFKSITDERGVPDDFVYPEGEEDVLGDHSCTWMMLREVLAFDWDQTTKKRGIVADKELEAMKKEGRKWPNAWCGGTSNMEGQSEYFWDVTYRECCDEWFEMVLPMLTALGDPEDVRLVMGFDS